MIWCILYSGPLHTGAHLPWLYPNHSWSEGRNSKTVMKQCFHHTATRLLQGMCNRANTIIKNKNKKTKQKSCSFTCFYSSESSAGSLTMVPRDKSQTCKNTQATTGISVGIHVITSDDLDGKLSHLILQMNDLRAPILILAEDCWLSFFTVPVFKSNILPLKANTDSCATMFIFTENSNLFHVTAAWNQE